METILFDWIADLRHRNLRVSRSMIMCEAKALSSNEEFKASVSWLNGFLKSYDLSLRRRTTVCQNPPAACVDIRLRRLIVRKKFTDSFIFAMDETPCWMDMPSDTTVHFSGSKSVSVKTTGHEKNHFTVVLADGMLFLF